MAFERAHELAVSRTKSLKRLAQRAVGKKRAHLFYRGADFSGADLRAQDLRGLDLTSVRFTGVNIDRHTKVQDTHLAEIFEAGAETIVSAMNSAGNDGRGERAGELFVQYAEVCFAFGHGEKAFTFVNGSLEAKVLEDGIIILPADCYWLCAQLPEAIQNPFIQRWVYAQHENDGFIELLDHSLVDPEKAPVAHLVLDDIVDYPGPIDARLAFRMVDIQDYDKLDDWLSERAPDDASRAAVLIHAISHLPRTATLHRFIPRVIESVVKEPELARALSFISDLDPSESGSIDSRRVRRGLAEAREWLDEVAKETSPRPGVRFYNGALTATFNKLERYFDRAPQSSGDGVFREALPALLKQVERTSDTQ